MRAIVLLLVFLFGLAAPAAADDVSAAQSVIRAQEQAFGRDDAAAAYSHAAPEIRQQFPQADSFMQWSSRAIHRSTATRALNSAKRARTVAGWRSASTSSTTMARPGKRCIRWSSNPTAV